MCGHTFDDDDFQSTPFDGDRKKRQAESSPCLNGGICTNVGFDFECDCSTVPFFGTTCEVDPCDPLFNECQNGGVCKVLDNATGQIQCDCGAIPFAGDFCQNDPCDDLTCENGGFCKVVDLVTDETVCDCDSIPFKGDSCEIDPCMTGGLDLDFHSGPFPNGRKKRQADQPDTANIGPCQNGGICTIINNITDAFLCNCDEIPFSGAYCTVDPCQVNNPCQNEGSCVISDTVTDQPTCDCSNLQCIQQKNVWRRIFENSGLFTTNFSKIAQQSHI